MSIPQRFTNQIGMEFVCIEESSFMMGSPGNEAGRYHDEGQHRVTLTKAFYIQTTQVTVGQWRAFVRDSGYKTEAETGGGAYMWTGCVWEKKDGHYWDNPGFNQTDRHPVTCISWNDVQDFIRWLNPLTGYNYRLPTEAEWEYACRAGSTAALGNGGLSELKCGHDVNLHAMGWYCGNANKTTHQVARKEPNAWGLYDMHGNVYEWCQDWYAEDCPSGHVTDPTGPSSGSNRVARGGGWYFYARLCRSASRISFSPGFRSYYLGFRLAKTP